MNIKKHYQYKLVKSDVPEILRNNIVKDVNVGGIKLSYEVSTVKTIVFMFLGKQYIIPISRRKNKETRHFLNPYKTFWDTSNKRNFLPKCLWGKNNHPLTNYWIELELDYTDVNSGEIIVKGDIRNTNITKHLSRTKELFYIEKNNY